MDAMEAAAISALPARPGIPAHFDFLDTAKPGYAKDVAEHGQRVADVPSLPERRLRGRETEFPLLGKRWKGQRGSALFFWNVETEWNSPTGRHGSCRSAADRAARNGCCRNGCGAAVEAVPV